MHYAVQYNDTNGHTSSEVLHLAVVMLPLHLQNALMCSITFNGIYKKKGSNSINRECVCGSQVTTKTVAQCVEFYYTYKKHVKIGRNGTLIYGEAEPLDSKTTEEEMDHKVSEMLYLISILQKQM